MATAKLRSVAEGDAEKILTWRNHPEIRRWMVNADPIPQAEHNRWMDGVLRGETSAAYRIMTLDAGFTYLTSIDPALGSAHWGGYLAPDVKRGAGCGFAMLFLMGLVAFDDLELEILRITAKGSNPVLSMYVRFGFKTMNEKRSRSQPPLQHMSLSKEGFEAARQSHSEALSAIGFAING